MHKHYKYAEIRSKYQPELDKINSMTGITQRDRHFMLTKVEFKITNDILDYLGLQRI